MPVVSPLILHGIPALLLHMIYLFRFSSWRRAKVHLHEPPCFRQVVVQKLVSNAWHLRVCLRLQVQPTRKYDVETLEGNYTP